MCRPSGHWFARVVPAIAVALTMTMPVSVQARGGGGGGHGGAGLGGWGGFGRSVGGHVGAFGFRRGLGFHSRVLVLRPHGRAFGNLFVHGAVVPSVGSAVVPPFNGSPVVPPFHAGPVPGADAFPGRNWRGGTWPYGFDDWPFFGAALPSDSSAAVPACPTETSAALLTDPDCPELWRGAGGAWHRDSAGSSPQVWHRDKDGNWHQESAAGPG